MIGLKFVSNSSFLHDLENKRKNHRGFKITYALSGKFFLIRKVLISNSDCGGEIFLAQNKLAASISSPGYPLQYHNELDCVWNITAPSGYVIAIK